MRRPQALALRGHTDTVNALAADADNMVWSASRDTSVAPSGPERVARGSEGPAGTTPEPAHRGGWANRRRAEPRRRDGMAGARARDAEGQFRGVALTMFATFDFAC